MLDTLRHHATAEDYSSLPEGAPCQLIDYELVMSPAPTSAHQLCLENLRDAFRDFLKSHGGGRAHFAPFDVHFSDGDVYQPDAFVIRTGNPGKMELNGFHGAPDIVIEVLSPTSVHYDLEHKRTTYERSGVKEYWVVDPMQWTIECLSNSDQGFVLTSLVQKEGIIHSQLLEGFSVEADDIFAR